MELKDIGLPIHINAIKKGFGICPLTASLAMQIERILAPFVLSMEEQQGFKNLSHEISDELFD